ncbi:trypsin-like cysteine/serine peptidase domain-containing protein, partial [Dimargaris cristalligena]
VVKGRSFPFMSMLTIVMDESSFLCGASLLSKDYLITAAHCVTNNGIPVSARSVTVGVGSNDAQDLRSYKVNRIHVHPDYDYENVVNDLALIRLRRPLDFDSGPEKIGTVAIAKEDLRDNEVFTAIGWGKTSSTGDISSSLREVNVTTGPSDACKAANPEFDGEDGRQICTAKNKNHDTCQGDSGGPLLLPVGPKDYQLAGITSYGYAPSDPNIICGTDSVVAYYTHVKYYIKWISE